jgi:hypothetical protein
MNAAIDTAGMVIAGIVIVGIVMATQPGIAGMEIAGHRMLARDGATGRRTTVLGAARRRAPLGARPRML